ncbi:MAG: hypothetical protein Q8P71_01305 [bacterium]|nr:hypothetical protein [bacterium]
MNVQQLFSHLHEKKSQRRKVKEAVRSELENAKGYGEVKEKLELLLKQKREIKQEVARKNDALFSKEERLSKEITEIEEQLNGAAFSQLVKGKDVTVRDLKNVPYDPVVTVKFKKADEGLGW